MRTLSPVGTPSRPLVAIRDAVGADPLGRFSLRLNAGRRGEVNAFF